MSPTGFMLFCLCPLTFGLYFYFREGKVPKCNYATEGLGGEALVESDDSEPDIASYWAGHLPKECEEIIDIVRFPEAFRFYGSSMPRGLLLYGDPGTGKTYFGKMLANLLDAHFFYAAASQMDEIYVGSGPKKIRMLFEKARNAARCGYVEETEKGGWLSGLQLRDRFEFPDVDQMAMTGSTSKKKFGQKNRSIIFLDEIDAFGNRTSIHHSEIRNATLSQLLSCMDGMDNYDNVLVVAATNYLDGVDSALKRSGRFDRLVQMPLPSQESRYELLCFYMKKVPNIQISTFVDLLLVLSLATEGFNCSDLRLLINEATLRATRQTLDHIKRKSSRISERSEMTPRDESGSFESPEPMNYGHVIEGLFHIYDKVCAERHSSQGVRKGNLLHKGDICRLLNQLNERMEFRQGEIYWNCY